MLGKEKLQIFRTAFKKANQGKCSMPNRFDFNKITEFEFYTQGMRGGIKSKFLFRKNTRGDYFLEFISGDDNSTWHNVIVSDGSIFGVKSTTLELGGEIILDKKNTAILTKAVVDERDRDQAFSNEIFAEKLPTKPEVDKRVNYW